MAAASEKPAPWSSAAIDAASHGAIAFCQIYYEAFDEPTRRSLEIPLFFLPTAKIVWNGNVVKPDAGSLNAFLNAFPLSRHDLQTLDCHPLKPLDPAAGGAPELVLTVTGSVLNGPSVMKSGDAPPVGVSEHPRKFREVFVLKPTESAEGMQPKYAIQSSNFRFIG
ncbi:NTF2-related export protein 2 [Vanrija pseudolonga]|uniref:NTF2-related export protein 2 n=1 Tax=Vanrija pseudolonga TaxID=143232 RepID=A0AAF1BN40_9TREE|nr:NTF2-related export protein 2 [Vanrija pseudolonga]